MAIDALDVPYVPSRDVEADVRFYRDTLGGRVIFNIDAMGTRVAEIVLAGRTCLLLADHLPGDAPVLLHRVSDLDVSRRARLRRWDPERSGRPNR